MEGVPAKQVWAPDPNDGFVLGEICDFGTETVTIQPLDGGPPITASFSSVYPAEEEGAPPVEDNCALMNLNEATLLHNLRRRYEHELIYTYTANILVAVNPYLSLNLYTPWHVEQYQGKSLGVLPPHVYAIADKAYRDMRNLGLSQSIVVSGESGAGKTESTKHVLKFLTDSYGGGGAVTDLEARIIAANPLLESFGNAKTTRNNNSSRFGKFVELHFNKDSLVVGAHIEHYLLEKSRVISQALKERNYHVFYRLCRGSPQKMRDAFNLSSDVEKYLYLCSGLTENVDGLDDITDFAVLENSMNDIGMEGIEKANVFRIVAAVLHIGNLCFIEGTAGGGEVTAATMPILNGVSSMLGVESKDLLEALSFTSITISGIESKKGKTPLDCEFGRDALAKAIYSKLFDWIVRRVNKGFPFEKSANYIGVLDIAGFEYFQHNGFEQFCINFANEKLQQFFNVRILKDEQDLYVKESIKFRQVEFVDNQDCIDLVEAKLTGIFALLDEECKLPRGTDGAFTEKIHNTHKNHFRLQLPRKSKLTCYKTVRDEEGFIVRHFAGAVCYQTFGFIEKNKDALTSDLALLMSSSKDAFIRDVFEPQPGDPRPQKGKIIMNSVGSKFKTALESLMDKLYSARSNFIRCVKPNQRMLPKVFHGAEILSQLQCSGMVSVLDLMQGGFPSRTSFKDLYNMYKGLLPPELCHLEPRAFCQALFRALGLDEDDFQFGVSKVFFRPGKFAEFDTIMKSDPDTLVTLVNKVVLWMLEQRWRKIAWACIACLKFQRKINARANASDFLKNVIAMHVARITNIPRYQCLWSLRGMSSQLSMIQEVLDKTKNKEKLIVGADALRVEVDQAIDSVKSTVHPAQHLKRLAYELQVKLDKHFAVVKKEQEKQKMAEEAERMRQVAEEMQREKARKEEEERRRLAAEEEAKAVKEMEERRRKEAEEEAKRLEKERIALEREEINKKVQEKRIADLKKEQDLLAQLEQERRDQELAMRLAKDMHNPRAALTAEAQQMIMMGPPQSVQRTTFSSKRIEVIHKKHNLGTWRFADLRDAVATSNDADLLDACREEFHHRIRFYHEWRMKNLKTRKMMQREVPRGPLSVEDIKPQPGAAATAARTMAKGIKLIPFEKKHRYFRVPYMKPGSSTEKKRGLWLGHFDGQWIARQLELVAGELPVLKVAGVDDLEMCELSLEQTGMTRRRGAEILQREFEDTWKNCGGAPYHDRAMKK